MRRWLLILFIAMLPLQFTWAAVASYCTHEEPPAQSQHFGHHEHEHHDGSGAEEHAGKKAVADVDNDCAYCHLGCSQPLPVTAFDLPTLAASSWVSGQSELHGSYFPPGLERPDRRLA